MGDPVEGDRVVRGDDRTFQTRPTPRGHHFDEGGADVRLQFDVEEGVATHRGQDRPEGRHTELLEGIRRHAVDAVRPAVDPGKGVVVVDHRDAVARGPDVELQSVAGRDRHRRPERIDRVLRGVSPVTAMGEAQGDRRSHRGR